MIEGTLAEPDLEPGARVISPPGRRASTAAAARAHRLIVTHYSDELDPVWAAAEAADSYGGPVELAARGRRLRRAAGPLRSVADRRCPSETCSPASTACGERWTSCSATRSSAPGLSRRRTGHWPPIDVAYASDPPRAIVTAELAGVRVLGHRAADRGSPADPRRPPTRLRASRARSTSRSRSSAGVFRRIVELGAEVASDAATARYEHGMLRIELPLVQRPTPPRDVPIETRRGRTDRDGGDDRDRQVAGQRHGRGCRDRSAAHAARPLRGAAAARRGHVPGAGRAAQHRPGALGRADQRRAARRPLAGARRRSHPPRSRRPVPSRSTTSACSARSRGWCDCPTTRCGCWCRAASASTSTSGCQTEPYLVAEVSELRRRDVRQGRS